MINDYQHIATTATIDCKRLVIGQGVTIGENCVLRADEICLGDDVHIDHDVEIDCTKATKIIKATKISIGDFSGISHHVRVFVPIFSMGDYCMLYNDALVYGKRELSIGHNCWIGESTILNSEDVLTIGNNVGIGTYSQVWTHGYWGEVLEGCLLNKQAPTVIEDDAWLVGHTIVSSGVRVGKQAIILPGAVITKSIPPRSVWGGSPAKDLTSKVECWREVSLSEKFDMMKSFVGEFANERYSGFYERDGDCFLFSKGGYSFAIDFCEEEGFYQPKREFVDTILIVKKFSAQAEPSANTCVLDLTSKHYVKRKLKAESELLLFLRSHRARFLPF